MKTSTRTLRLIAATAAALVLMTAVAQARPMSAPTNGATSASASLAPDRADKVGTTAQRGLGAPIGSDTVVVNATSGNGGFDWADAGIGAAGGLGLSMLAVGGVLVAQRRGHRSSAQAAR
jgi:hypothetical protein